MPQTRTQRFRVQDANIETLGLSTGTPVMAFRCGSVEEILRDGETGFMVDPDELVRDLAREEQDETPR